jgi:predicted 3-demethylubiquinone-9 3-methyltransferase (glyoxalase superfamily)
MNKITTCLWFDDNAAQAADFYLSIFPDAKDIDRSIIENTPSGSTEIIEIELADQGFTLISAGPLFKVNPTISFLIACDTKDEVGAFWKKLSEGGTPLMELGEYPFSERYGWIQDQFGVSWQVMLKGEMDIEQKITPTMMFAGEVAGKTEEAIGFYTSIFKNSKVRDITRYGAGEEPDKEGTIKHIEFTIEGQDFAAMDSAQAHGFAFNEAISLIVNCEDQTETDYYWDKLTAIPEAENCGWLKDKYGVSWQIVPVQLSELMKAADENGKAQITEALLEMKKLDVGALRRAAGV